MKGLIHEGIGVTGEEHIVLCRTPVLQEGVQILDGALFSFRGACGGMVGWGTLTARWLRVPFEKFLERSKN